MITIVNAAPLPVSEEVAVAKAAQLAAHISWASVAYVMGEYHGVWRSAPHWRRLVRVAGIRPQYVGGRARQSLNGPRNLRAA